MADLVATPIDAQFQTLFHASDTVGTHSTLEAFLTSTRTGTITLNDARTEVAYSGIGWKLQAHSHSFDLDVVHIEIDVDEIVVAQIAPQTLPVLTNSGRTVSTAGLNPSTSFTVSNVSGSWTITGPSMGEETDTFDFAPTLNTTPFGETLDVTRSGSRVTGPITGFSILKEGLALGFSAVNPLFDGTVDGVPVKLELRGFTNQYKVAST